MFLFFYIFTIVFYYYTQNFTSSRVISHWSANGSSLIHLQIWMKYFFSSHSSLTDIEMFKRSWWTNVWTLLLLWELRKNEREKRRAWMIKPHGEDFFRISLQRLTNQVNSIGRHRLFFSSFQGSLSIFQCNIRKSPVEKWEKNNAFCPWLLLREGERNLSSTNIEWLMLYYHPVIDMSNWTVG